MTNNAPKGPGGRPEMSINERRCMQVKIRLTIAELEHIRKQAEASGVTMAEYTRRRALDLRLRHQTKATDAKLLYELNALGNNINQIARSLNRGREDAQTISWDIVQQELLRVIGLVGDSLDD